MNERAVRATEYELILLTRAVLGDVDPRVAPLLRGARPLAEALTPSGVAGLRATVATGLVRAFARGGGARVERFGGQPGRLWDRHPAPDLLVTARSVDLLRWALREPLAARDHAACPVGPAVASGDRVIAFGLARLLVGSGLASVLGERVFRDDPLVQIAFAAAVAPGIGASLRPEPPDEASGPDFAPFLRTHALYVEALWLWIAAGIVDSDAAPLLVADAVASSAHRRRTYAAWIAACEAVGRWDLAVPLVHAAVAAMACPSPPPLSDPNASARDRAAAARAGTVLAEVTVRLADHLARLGTLEFFDDGYAEAQALRHRWAGLEAARPIAEGRVRTVAGV